MNKTLKFNQFSHFQFKRKYITLDLCSTLTQSNIFILRWWHCFNASKVHYKVLMNFVCKLSFLSIGHSMLCVVPSWSHILQHWILSRKFWKITSTYFFPFFVYDKNWIQCKINCTHINENTRKMNRMQEKHYPVYCRNNR